MSLPAIHETESDSDTLRTAGASSSAQNASDTDKKASNEKLPSSPKKDDQQSEEDGDTALGTVQTLKNSAREKLHLDQVHATSVWRGFNPTSARFHIRWKHDEDGSDSNKEDSEKPPRTRDDDDDGVAMRWSSRYNRKGRNSFVVSRRPSADQRRPSYRMHRIVQNVKRIGKNIVKMLFGFPYWDMAFWSGWAYSWGSVLFVIDGAFAFVPLAFPYTEFEGEAFAVGVLFFIGALLYEVGATVAYLEAINDGSFHGSAMKRFLDGHDEDKKKLLDQKLGAFFGHIVPLSSGRGKAKRKIGRVANAVDVEAGWFPDKQFIESDPASYRERRGGVDFGTTEEGETMDYLPFRWWPTWHSLKTHHIKEIGFWACSIQLFGATLFAICGTVALPPIIDSLEDWQLIAAYWVPEVVGSCCFLTASCLFTFETQEKWYKPEPTVLGWWVGFCSGVGSVGFLLCGCFGLVLNSHWASYQSSLSSTWGSFAYLMCGLLQWYEAVNKNPIAEMLTEPGNLKSFQIRF